MSGILFLATQNLDQIRKFYQAKIGMSLWLDQGDCAILKHGNLMLGFCQGKSKKSTVNPAAGSRNGRSL